MSWMDSWSRPSKSQATPAPYYLTNPTEAKYCHTCGRIIGQRRAHTNKAGANNEVKYCSDRCKRSKPSTAAESLDVRIEKALGALLQGLEPPPGTREGQGDGAEDGAKTSEAKAKGSGKKHHVPKKGDPRIIVALSEVEEAVFGNRQDPEKTYGRRKNRAFRGVKDAGEWKSVDMVDSPSAALSPTNSTDNGNMTDDSMNAYDSYDSDGSRDSAAGGVAVTSDAEPVAVSPSDNTFIPPSKPLPGSHIRASQLDSELNFAAQGGERGWAEKITETPEMLARRREGQKKAEERELVRCVARRAVVFGIEMDARAEVEAEGGKGKKGGKKGKKGAEADESAMEDGKTARKRCEALMDGAVVEPSFAKGDWSVRWREEY